MDQSQIPSFGAPQNQNPYYVPEPGISKNIKWLVLGGVLLILALLYVVFFSGGGAKGQPEMLETLETKAQAIAILDDYIDDVEVSSLKNDLALSLILLRGNYQTMTDLYTDTFSGGKKPPSTPKLSEETEEVLERAKRNNVLETEIIKVLKSNLSSAQSSLIKTKEYFTKPSSRQIINDTQEDLEAVYDILNKSDLV